MTPHLSRPSSPNAIADSGSTWDKRMSVGAGAGVAVERFRGRDKGPGNLRAPHARRKQSGAKHRRRDRRRDARLQGIDRPASGPNAPRDFAGARVTVSWKAEKMAAKIRRLPGLTSWLQCS